MGGGGERDEVTKLLMERHDDVMAGAYEVRRLRLNPQFFLRHLWMTRKCFKHLSLLCHRLVRLALGWIDF